MATPVVLQTEASECGLACLAMVACHHGLVTDLAALRRRWSLSLKGVTLAQLMAMAQGLNLSARALRVELEDLSAVATPAILHWDLDHFVVLERAARRRLVVIDPAVGRRRLAPAEVSAHFTGVALELQPADGFEPRREAAPLPLRAFFTRMRGLAPALVRVLVLSVALQAFVLVMPFFSQLIIDEVAVTGARDLLTVLGIAFLLMVGVQVCISLVRGWLVAALGATLQFGWVVRLFRHLLRLPLAWFEKRHVGDVLSRFRSIRAVERLVAGTAVEALLDGLMAVTTLAVMLYYSPALAAVSVAAVLCYAGARLASLGRLRAASNEAIAADARESSLFMESVRAILPLKNYGRETLRESVWQAQRARALNAEVRVQRLQVVQQSVNLGVFGAERIMVLWLGALAVMDARLSVGMLVAFLSYRHQFGSCAAALIDKLIEFRLVRVHLDRIADLALAARDPAAVETAPGPAPRLRGALAARGLAFRYADTEPLVIDGLDLEIGAGECVAITAPSGTGKTTLLKLLLGLLRPTAGVIAVDGVDLARAGLGRFRRQAAAVMQDDSLLSGTLADNIALFDPAPDLQRIAAAARVAAIDADVAAMPMGWQTLVGDMGSALSGGQRQRILLARALYHRPRVLVLDEATSHLDPPTERRIHAALQRMRITRVLVAHRQETLAIADRVISLGA